MDLEELFTNLSYGVLKNLSIGGEGSGLIPAEERPKLVSYVNKSLTSIFGRFNLIQKELVIRLQDDLLTYLLEPRFADEDPTVGVKYIEDNPAEPFIGDVLKILQIFDDEGFELPMNDPGRPEESVFTPDDKAVLYRGAETGKRLFLMYQAKHPKLVSSPPVGMSQEILVPDILMPALEAHVGYQCYSYMNGLENAGKAQEFIQFYGLVIKEIEDLDLVSTSVNQTHFKLEGRGFA